MKWRQKILLTQLTDLPLQFEYTRRIIKMKGPCHLPYASEKCRQHSRYWKIRFASRRQSSFLGENHLPTFNLLLQLMKYDIWKDYRNVCVLLTTTYMINYSQKTKHCMCVQVIGGAVKLSHTLKTENNSTISQRVQQNISYSIFCYFGEICEKKNQQQVDDLTH